MGAALWDCPAIFAESRWENRDSVTPPSAFPDETTWEGGAPVWDMTTCASEFPALSGLTTAARFSVAPVCSGVLFDAALKRSGDVPRSAATGVRDAATGEAGRLVKRIPPESESVFLSGDGTPLAVPPLAAVGAGGAEALSEGAGRFEKRVSPESEGACLSEDGTPLDVPPPVVADV